MIKQSDIDKNKELIKIGVILLIVIIAATAGKKILDTILQALNLQDTAEEKAKTKEAESLEKLSVDFFRPSYYKNPPAGYERGPNTISMKNAHAVAKKIYDSIGYIYDSPDQTKAAFNMATSKHDISKIADAFNSDYNKDLLSFISSKLDTEKQKNTWILVLKDLNKLPSGFSKIKK